MSLRDRQMLTMELDNDRLSAALRALLKDKLPGAINKACRKVAFDVVAETQKALNGELGGLPKRIDTGRLRGGWRVAMQNGGLPTRGLAKSSANRPEDGSATITGKGTDAISITVANNVEYAEHVEYGTETMAPGMHLQRALRVVAQQVPNDNQPESLRREIAKAWERG